MRKDPYAKERAEMQIKLKKGDSSVNRFFDVLMESAKGEPGHTPLKGKDYWTKEERAEMVAEITALIPVPKDADEVDYDLVLSYVTQEVEKRVSEEVAKIPPAERGLPGKDAVVDIPAIVESLLKVMPKMESTEVDYLGVKEYIDKQITSIKAEPRVIKQFTGGGATSLKQLTDVVLDGLSQDSKGNYILSGGGSVSDEVYSGTWDGVTDEAPSKNAVYDKIQSLSLGAGAGDVVGPISSINNRIVTFDGITGKLIKDSGSVVGDFATASHNHTGVYEPADATILKDADIGVSVASQSHNHTGVYAPALGADDNYVTDAEKVVIGNTSGTNTGDQTLPTRASLGLATTDSPQFAGVNVGHATDTTITRSAAGMIAVEGVVVPTISSTDTLTNKTLTSPVLTTPNLGTPSTLVGTNITGTASGLTAGNVTTNANLTGVVTSVGNATAIADSALSIAKTSGLQSALDLKAPLASPTFTGTVTVPTPSNATDAVTKAYADAITQSLDIKQSVRVASTANITIASALINGSTIDGVVVATGDRVLLKDQTAGAENGIYLVVASGAATRSTDADVSADVTSGMYVFVSEGTVSADMGYVLTTNDPITLGTTQLTFTQFSGASQITAGTGITKTGNTLAVDTTVVPVKTDNLSVFGATTSAQLAGVISDETGTGSLVFNTSPAFTTGLSTPAITTASGALTVTPAAGSNLNLNLSTTGDFAVNTDDLYVDTSTGNVGVGTTSPDTRLVVGLDTAGQSNYITIGKGWDTSSGLLWGRGGVIDTRIESNETEDLVFSINEQNLASTIDFIFKGNNTEILRISNTGNVGIGTTTPLARLDLDTGGIRVFGDITTDAQSDTLTFLGVGAGASNTVTGTGFEGLYNTAVGNNALYFNTTGYNNTANGRYTLYYNTTGYDNTALGNASLYYNTTGYRNTATGRYALFSNTTGYNNTANGVQALNSNTTGYFNTAVGNNALRSNTTGSNNTALGQLAGYDINTATSTGANTVIGYNTGRGITTGVNNTILGANVTGLSAGLSNNIIIADGAGNQRINVGSTGNVGIGDTNPTLATLVVGSAGAGSIYLTPTASGGGSALCWDNAGASLIYDCSSAPIADYAESYAVTSDIDYGDIVMATTEQVEEVSGAYSPLLTKATVGGPIIGIVSDNYNDFTSTAHDNFAPGIPHKPVALNGRVPVKVNLEGGEIAVGDKIAVSSVNGVGKKATKTGETIIGTALAEYNTSSDGETVLVFVGNGTHTTLADKIREGIFSVDLTSTTTAFATLLADQTDTVWSRLTRLAEGFVNGVLTLTGIKTERIDTDKLCVGNTCVTETELIELLNRNQVNTVTPNTPSNGSNLTNNEINNVGDVTSTSTSTSTTTTTSTSTSTSTVPNTVSTTETTMPATISSSTVISIPEPDGTTEEPILNNEALPVLPDGGNATNIEIVPADATVVNPELEIVPADATVVTPEPEIAPTVGA